ncbi:MAG TPA: Cof-type HAD-IIB family hydrolase [Candidatus Nanopelagicales bacterium]|nr:Cof-type HAD-IIB family hydrolase [Candidatus Nanopelagicales bacterium]
MSGRRIRLVALDLDGTLIGDDLRLPPRTVATIRAVVARGVHVALVTGRMTSSALPYARQLGLRAPLVGLQGALVREMPAPGSARLGRLLLHRPLPADVARDAIAWCRGAGLTPHVNHLERMVIPAGDERAEDYARWDFGRVVLVPDLESWIRGPVTKIVSVGPPPLADLALEHARADFAGRADPTVSHPMFLEFVAPGVNKGRAVRFLARRLGVDLRDALAIGDQGNDVEMIAEVGMGVAMGGAPAAVRAVARLVAPPLAEEGAAQVLEDLVLGGRPA